MTNHYCPKHNGEWECEQSLCSGAEKYVYCPRCAWLEAGLVES